MGNSESEGSDVSLGDLLCLSPRRAGYLGLLSIAIFVACWVIGALVDDNWVLFEDNLCHLGVSDIVFVRVLYPIGCLLTGSGLMLFGYSIARSCTRRLQAAGYYSCILFGFSMMGIGAINMDFSHDVHMYFVYLMGVAAAIVLALITIDDIRNRRWAISAFVIFIAVGFLFFTFYNDDYQQAFTITAMLIWLAIKSRGFIVADSVP